MTIYPYLSYRREINETNVPAIGRRYGTALTRWMEMAAYWSTIPVVSGDFLTRWNAITVRKGREKGQFWGNSYFWIEFFLKDGLGLLPYEGTTFIPNISS